MELRIGNVTTTQNVIALGVGIAGGWLLSLTGFALAWMLGAMIATMFLSVTAKKKWVFSKRWRWIAQIIIAVHLGRQIQSQLFVSVISELMYILLCILLTVCASLLIGWMLWKVTDVDPATALFGTVPGGATEMAVIAEEMGGSPVLVALLQSIRMILIIVVVPLAIWSFDSPETTLSFGIEQGEVQAAQVFHTLLFIGVAIAGWKIGKIVKLFTPALVGGVLLVSVTQLSVSWVSGVPIEMYWPPLFVIVAQVLLGISIGIGFRIHQSKGATPYLVFGMLGNLVLMGISFVISTGYHYVLNKELTTALLAFAPGGVMEMAITAFLFDANPPFVAAVQLIRMLVIMSVAPILVRMLLQIILKRQDRKPYSLYDNSIRSGMEEP